MARRTRVEWPGAAYWIEGRCFAESGEPLGDVDRSLFEEILGHVVERHRWRCWAYCVLPDGYHLVVETPGANLSKGMRDLNGEFTQAYNRTRGRKGPVFRGRFHAWPVEKGKVLLEACRAVVLAPVTAGLVKKPAKWTWSSFGPTAGLRDSQEFLDVAWLLEEFGGKPKKARARYEKFVKAGTGTAAPVPRHGLFIGSETFGASVLRRGTPAGSRGSAKSKRPPLKALLGGRPAKDLVERDRRIAEAYLDHGYTLAAIGKVADLHPGTVSRIVKKMEGESERAGERGNKGKQKRKSG